VQAFDSFAQSCVDGGIIGIPVSRVQQHTRHIPLCATVLLIVKRRRSDQA
jgi:hypothetical protein